MNFGETYARSMMRKVALVGISCLVVVAGIGYWIAKGAFGDDPLTSRIIVKASLSTAVCVAIISSAMTRRFMIGRIIRQQPVEGGSTTLQEHDQVQTEIHDKDLRQLTTLISLKEQLVYGGFPWNIVVGIVLSILIIAVLDGILAAFLLSVSHTEWLKNVVLPIIAAAIATLAMLRSRHLSKTIRVANYCCCEHCGYPYQGKEKQVCAECGACIDGVRVQQNWQRIVQ